MPSPALALIPRRHADTVDARHFYIQEQAAIRAAHKHQWSLRKGRNVPEEGEERA